MSGASRITEDEDSTRHWIGTVRLLPSVEFFFSLEGKINILHLMRTGNVVDGK